LPIQKKTGIFYVMKVLKIFRPLDFVIIGLFVAAAGLSLVNLRRGEKKPALLVVNAPDGEYLYPLDENRELQVKGILGESIVVIQDGKAFFRESPCPNKTCVQTGNVAHHNDWAACLPNQVIIHVEAAGEKDEVDASTR